MRELEKLLAIESIKQLKARYCRLMDTKDWGAWVQLFTVDAVMDMRVLAGGGGPAVAPHTTLDVAAQSAETGLYIGPAAIRQYVSAPLEDAIPVHHAHMPEIEILDDHRAQGIWSMEFHTRWPGGIPLKSIHGFGHYHDTYQRIAEQWFIKATRLTTTIVDTA